MSESIHFQELELRPHPMTLVACMLTGMTTEPCLGVFLRRHTPESPWLPASYPFQAWFNHSATQLEPQEGYVNASVRRALLSGSIRVDQLRDKTTEALTNSILNNHEDGRPSATLNGEDLSFAVLSEPVVESYLKSLRYVGEAELAEDLIPAYVDSEVALGRSRLAGVEHLLDRLGACWSPARLCREDDTDLLLRAAVKRFHDDRLMLEALAEYVRWDEDESITLEELLDLLQANEKIFDS